MNYQQAEKKALTVKWKTEPCHQETCWCLIISPEDTIKDEEGNEIYIVPSGTMDAKHAKHIVALHNDYIKSNSEKGSNYTYVDTETPPDYQVLYEEGLKTILRQRGEISGLKQEISKLKKISL